MSDGRRHKYRVLTVEGTARDDGSGLTLYRVTVRPDGANDPKTVLLVESASQPYPPGAVVELCPEWMMPAEPA